MITYLKYFIKKLLNKKDTNNWKLATFKSDLKKILESRNAQKDIFRGINIIENKKDEFAADPFLFKFKGKNFVFYEKFNKKQNKGVISVAKLKDNKLYNDRDIIVKDYHLSYPNLLKYNNNIYLIPENYQAKKLNIYKFISFPYKLKLVKSFLHNEIVADPTFFKYKNSLWFFVNKAKKDIKDLNKNLFLYKINKNFTKITPHNQNPIKRNLYGGRSAGSIFRYQKKYIRPAQINKKETYGFGLVFFEIKKLNLDTYIEKKITSILPSSFKNCHGVHHFSYLNNNVMIDLNLTE